LGGVCAGDTGEGRGKIWEVKKWEGFVVDGEAGVKGPKSAQPGIIPQNARDEAAVAVPQGWVGWVETVKAGASLPHSKVGALSDWNGWFARGGAVRHTRNLRPLHYRVELIGSLA
jgi:hypothetical protein